MLNLKRILLPSVAMLGLLSVVGASGATEKAKNYEVSLNTAMKVGSQVLAAGDYKLKLEGSNAVFTRQSNGRNKETFTASATLEAGDAKFDHTTIHSVQDGGQPRITSIELRGGKELLKLN